MKNVLYFGSVLDIMHQSVNFYLTIVIYNCRIARKKSEF